MPTPNPTVTSPCIGLCSLFDGVCMGCFRNIEEISDWHDMDDQQRQQVIDGLEERRRAIEAEERR
ncbi:MAG: DUF1289 domain-containing protein [Pseudomonadales bacterium]